MIDIKDLLTPKRVCYTTDILTKKRVMEFLSNLLAKEQVDMDSADILQQFIARERLGSTAIGDGVALPHIRMKNIDTAIGALVHLHSGVDFDKPNYKSVDLVFGLIVPEETTDEHLKILSMLAEKFSQAKFRSLLRETKNSTDLYNAACGQN